MFNVHTLALNPGRNRNVEIFPRLPMLTSDQAAWHGLHLEYHRQPAHETPEFHLEQHLISIYVGHPGINLMMNGTWQPESYKPGDIVILPAHQPLKTGWDREAEFIKLYLDPLVLSAQARA
jgi:AraC family transcriptional regulator